MNRRHGGVRKWLTTIAISGLAASAIGWSAAGADVGDIGYEGPSSVGVGPSHPSAEKPESKLWFAYGSWWGAIWSTSRVQYTIHRLDLTSHDWIDTGVTLETDKNNRLDSLFDGTKLYVASHRYATSAGASPARLTRYSFSTNTGQWSRDAGFPATISNERSETLVIDKDTTGRLWATWTTAGTVRVTNTNCSPTCVDTSWATPTTMSTIPSIGTAASITSDDISSVIAFGGKVGVMFSNQGTPDAMYFAVRNDTDPVGSWTLETAISGPSMSDDHINLATDGGTVFAATKTSLDTTGKPQTLMLKRTPAGAWSSAVTSFGEHNTTRPIVLFDQANNQLWSYMGNNAGGSIYEKSAPAGTMAFPSGIGTPVMFDASANDMNDPTSTKQSLTAQSDLVVLATDNVSKTYWHHERVLDPGAPTLTADFSGTPLSGEAPVNVQFTDASTGGALTWSWNFGDGGTSNVQNPSHVYTVPGTYAVSLTVSGAAGQATTTKTGYVTVSAPQPLAANFTATPATGTAPLNVTFTDTSTGNPTSWFWDFGDGTTSTERNPVHTYGAIGQYDVILTIGRNGVFDSETRVAAVTVTDQLVVTPSADTYIRQDAPTRNYGSATFLRNRSSTTAEYRSLLKFDVGGLTGGVDRAVLRLFVTDESPQSGAVHAVASTWTETGVTWNTAPQPTPVPTAASVNAPLGQWIEFDVTSAVTGNGSFSFLLTPASTNSVYFDSREGPNKPQLVITKASLGADFTGPVTAEIGTPITFTDTSTGQPTSWAWDFGDGTTSTAQNPAKTYTTAGTYDVRLTVGRDGDTDTELKTGYVTVTAPAPLDASFTSPTTVYVGQPITFTDTSTGSPTSWSWNPGDGSPAITTQHATHTYTAPGMYTVALTVGRDGLTDTETRNAYLVVTPPPTAIVVPAAADSYIRSDRTTTNYGTLPSLRNRAETGAYRSILRFDVPTLTGPVQRAVLRLFVTDASPTAGDAYLVDSNWTETGITWATQPALGAVTATGAPAVAGQWVEWDVTSAVTGQGSFSFLLVSSSTNSVYFDSREATNVPQLVVTQ